MKAATPNCIDIVKPLVGELHNRGLLDGFQIMGGIGSAALKHPGTVILPDEQRIVTSRDFTTDNDDLDVYRPNTTLRDLDVLVLSSDTEQISKVESLTEEVIGDQLDISFFSLRQASHLQQQIEHPFGVKSLKTFVSDRYVFEDGSIVKALVPFAVRIGPQVLESWQVEIGGEEYPVANPASAIQNYLTRSISGLRPKDFDKVQEMTKQVAGKWPDMAEWIKHGPGKTQMQLATIFQTLRHGSRRPNSKSVLDVGGAFQVSAISPDILRYNPAFMFPEAEPRVQTAILLLARLKSRGLGIPESNPTIVKLFQTFAEKRLDTITKNK